MRPPMHQKVFIRTENDTGEVDRYGRPILTEQEQDYRARVRYKSNVIRTSEGAVYDSDVEIDVMPDTPVETRQTIDFLTIEGERKTGIIENIEDAVNLSGNRVLFKVLMVNGR